MLTGISIVQLRENKMRWANGNIDCIFGQKPIRVLAFGLFGILLAKTVTLGLFLRIDARAIADEIQKFKFNIQKGKVLGKVNAIRVTQGDKVEINSSTDESVSLHLHGYNIKRDAKPNETAAMIFRAHAAGRFPISVHGHRNKGKGRGHSHEMERTILYVDVYPP